MQLEYEVTRTDGDGDVVTESAEVDLITNDASFFSFDDDGPTLTVTAEVSETEAAALAVELDETTGDADRYSSADTPDTYVNDDNGYLAQATTNVDGGLISLFATLGGDYGSDGAGTTVSSLSFVGPPCPRAAWPRICPPRTAAPSRLVADGDNEDQRCGHGQRCGVQHRDRECGHGG